MYVTLKSTLYPITWYTLRCTDEWRIAPRILNLSTGWTPVNQLHTLDALAPETDPMVHTGEEAEWAPERVWTLWRRERSHASAGNRTSQSLVSIQISNTRTREKRSCPYT
jgi:hypothetical protein